MITTVKAERPFLSGALFNISGNQDNQLNLRSILRSFSQNE
jgi:hypothetical protein